ncbi:MAG: MG2 domain-containing protein [Acidobacteriota bacterium]
MKTRNWLASTVIHLGIYLGIAICAFSVSTLRPHAQGESATPAASPQASATPKPHFSLSTNRTYSPSDRARVWITYQDIDYLDFRVYRVREPLKFFKQLNDPHQMGEQEKTQVAASYKRTPSALERLRSFKSSIYYGFKRYARTQLQQESRVTFNDKFRSGARRPLFEADYARVPLLNPDQMVKSWRETLTPLANEYDSRNVPLDKTGPGVYLVEAVNGDLRAYTVAVVTDLTVLTKTAPSGEIIVYAVNRKTGEPRSNLQVEIVKGRKLLAEGNTDSDGLMKSRVVRQKDEPRAEPTPAEDVDPAEEHSDVGSDSYLIMVSGGDQFAISDLEPYYFGWYDEESGDQSLVSYIYTDRPVYRPNQKVYFRGILRRLGDKGYETMSGQKAMVTIEDPKEAKIFERELTLTGRGTFSGEVDVAGGAPLGGYRIVSKVGTDVASGYFEVAEYKKPEYKVTIKTPKPFVPVGEKTKFSIEAKYFFGAPVANAEVQYYIYRSHYYHWWWRAEDDGIGGDENEDEEGGGYGYGNDMVKDGQARLDSNGRLDVEFAVPPPDAADSWDYTYRIEAQVTDSARRAIDGRASFVGTRGSIVATAQPERYVYYQGDNARIKINTSDYEGKPLAAKLTLKFIKRTWDRVEAEGDSKYKRFEYKLRETELASTELSTNAQGEASYDYKVPVTGSIYLKTIVNEAGKQVVSQGGYLWAADRGEKWADFAFEDSGSIKLVPDKKSYQPGETAHVLAMLPTDGAHLLVTTELAGVLSARRLNAPSRAVMIDVPIEARYAPNVYLTVAYVKDGEMYTSDKMLAVPARNKFLSVEIVPDKKEYKPRDVASYTVLARQADGSPAAGAELSFGLVDEAIYSVRPDTTGDIRKAFYGRRYNRVQTNFSTSFSFTGYSAEKPVKLALNRRAFQLADFKNESQYAEPTIRKDFKDTAYWQADAVTGGDGRATIKVNLPDNLTTWRATARAVTADTQVGAALAKVLSRKDLILRLETPRFATEGDTVTISGIVHNYLDAEKATKVSIEVTGGQLLDAPSQMMTIAKQGEQRVNWRISTSQVGEVRLLAKALTDAESDAIELPLPVVPVGLHETRGGTSTVANENGEATIALELPANANAQARTLRIEAAPSIAGTLFGALDYLTSFPYGCTEQTMSSFLPNVVVAQTLKDVKTTSLRTTNDLDKKVARGLDRLYRYQHQDGGWGWWKDDQTDPFMTAYVVDGLALARGAGYAIESWRLDQAREKMKQLLESGKTERNRGIDLEDRAYLVYALTRSGDTDVKFTNDLFAKRSELRPYGKALLALALRARGENDRAREVAVELERLARSSEFDAHWESKRRPMLDFEVENDIEATALGLKAMVQLLPQSPLLPKLARWLVGNRSRGYYWSNTKQTAFALLGLSDYLKVSQELAPDYSLEVYLNGEQVFSRRVTPADATTGQTFVIERKGVNVPAASSVRVVKRGRGMLYLSSTLDYFTRDENVPPKSTPNLTLARDYLRLKVTETAGKPKWTTEPLTGDVRSGDLIVSRLRVTGARAQYLMVEDPIPAGCEQVERVNGLELDYSTGKWSDWYSAREFRDQRTALFVDYFDGDATFQYALRVIVPGDFRAAPARAELMYQPTVQSNTGNIKLTFLDRK